LFDQTLWDIIARMMFKIKDGVVIVISFERQQRAEAGLQAL
jgi:hypothetical protein